MKRMRTKRNTNYDISPEQIMPGFVIIVLAVVIICALACGVAADSARHSKANATEYNEQVARFNAMSLSERQTIAEWTQSEDIDPETYLMTERDADMPGFILAQIHGPENADKMIPYYIVGILTSISLCTFVLYWVKFDSDYYLCSLPYWTWYGRILFLIMYAGWPIMLVSFICMRVKERKKIRDARKLKQENRKKERANVKKMAERELEEAAFKMVKSSFPARAEQAFMTFVMKKQPEACQSRVREAEVRVKSARQRLENISGDLREAQARLGRAQADLKRAEQDYSDKIDPKVAKMDWETIKNARGVSKIVYNKRRKRLEVTIEVRVPYKDELYDFGDYMLYIDGSSRCNCFEIRSGVREDATSTRPRYRDGNQFCFGGNLSTIEKYLGDGRYAEAVTLMVEYMHSVNNEDAAEQIPNCFRKMSVVEKAERKILLRNKIMKFLKGSEA